MTDLFDLLETKVDEETQRTGAMIALRPRQDMIDRLALEHDDAEKPEELHLTILFLGKAADYSYDTRDRIIYAMREIARSFRQVTGKAFGANHFNPRGDEPCVVLGVGGKELVDIRDAIIQKLQGFDLLQVPEQHEPWVPHVTLAYTDDDDVIEEVKDRTGDEVVFDAIRIAFGGIVDDVMLQPAVSTDDGYAGPTRYGDIPGEDVKSFTPRLLAAPTPLDVSRAHSLLGFKSMETKGVRKVRTAAGVRRFGQPIGTVIVSDGKSPLKNLKIVESEYDGYDKFQARGKTYYTHKNGDKYEALDERDNVIASNASEEGLLRDLDSGKVGKGTTGKVTAAQSAGSTSTVSKRGRNKAEDMMYKNITRQTSDYEGYDKYKASDGTYYVDQSTNDVYDENDEVVYYGTRKEVMEWLNGDATEAEPEPKKASAAKPKASSSSADDADKRPAEDLSGDWNESVHKAYAQAFKSAIASLNPSSSAKTIAKLNELAKELDDPKITPKALIEKVQQMQDTVTGGQRRSVLGNVLSKMKNTLRNQRESKEFQILLKEDPWLRGLMLSTKLITPGGRVGSDRSLGSTANGQNWVEKTPMGRLPKYIRIVANGLKGTHGKSRAIALAVAAVKRWARGGDHVRPQVQAAAAKAVAEWEALVASA